MLCTNNGDRDFGEGWDTAENVETNRAKSPTPQTDVLSLMDCALFFWQGPLAQQLWEAKGLVSRIPKRTLDVVAPGKRANRKSGGLDYGGTMANQSG